MKRRGTSRILSPAEYEELLETVLERDDGCWFRDQIPHLCSGVGEAAHLIPQSDLKRYFLHGAVKRAATIYGEDGSKQTLRVWMPKSRIELPFKDTDEEATLAQICRDARNVVCACSFIHKIFDAGFYRHQSIDFPRALLPAPFELFVNEFRLEQLAVKRFPVLTPDDFDNPLGLSAEELPEPLEIS